MTITRAIEPWEAEDYTARDPQPRAILDPSFDIFDVLRWATHTAYPEARIPETEMYRPTYHAIKCPCGHPVCEAWMVEPVAAVQGVKFTQYQAERVAELLNHMSEAEMEAAGIKRVSESDELAEYVIQSKGVAIP